MQIRPVARGDADGLALVHTESGRDAYRDFLPAETLDSPDRLAHRRAIWDDVLARLEADHREDAIEAAWVAVDGEDEDDVVGLVHVWRSPDRDARDGGEISTLYVATDRQGAGVGTGLLHVAVDHLLDAGCLRLLLWTLEENRRAQAFYEARGWRPDGRSRPIEGTEYEAREIRMTRSA